MKTTKRLLIGLLALTLPLAAAEPSKPPAFQVRLVVDSASADSELLPLLSTQPAAQSLHVQKQVLLDRSALKSAAVQKNSVTGSPEIQIVFTEAGAKRFGEVTRQHIGERLAIVIDGKAYSAPKVMTEIAGGKAVISGSFGEEEAAQLARRLTEATAK